jgi:hypothetical protein
MEEINGNKTPYKSVHPGNYFSCFFKKPYRRKRLWYYGALLFSRRRKSYLLHAKTIFHSFFNKIFPKLSKKFRANRGETRSKSRVFHYDPTYVVPESVTDGQGKVIARKGATVNPLKGLELSSGLLFLDGTNPAHIQWAAKQKGSFKWILVRGNPFALEEQEKRPVYFDQNAFTTKKLRIQHVPARVTQDGLKLKIEEVPINNEGEEKCSA